MQPGAPAPQAAPPAEDGGGDAQAMIDSIGKGIEQLGQLIAKVGDENDSAKLAEVQGAFQSFVQYLQQPEAQEPKEKKAPGGSSDMMGGPNGQPMM